jgi:hypothetical protein
MHSNPPNSSNPSAASSPAIEEQKASDKPAPLKAAEIHVKVMNEQLSEEKVNAIVDTLPPNSYLFYKNNADQWQMLQCVKPGEKYSKIIDYYREIRQLLNGNAFTADVIEKMKVAVALPPFTFVIEDRKLTAAERDQIASKMDVNTYLLVKDDADQWQLYYITGVLENEVVKRRMDPKNIKEYSGLVELLGKNDYSDQAKDQIVGIFKNYQKKDAATKIFSEFISTEDSMHAGIQAFIARINELYSRLDQYPHIQRQLDAYLVPYKKFRSPFEGVQVDLHGAETREQKIGAYDRTIVATMKDATFQNNIDIFLEAAPLSQEFQKFLVTPFHGKESITSIDDEIQREKLGGNLPTALIGLQGVPLTRLMRYKMLLEEMVKHVAVDSELPRQLEIAGTRAKANNNVVGRREDNVINHELEGQAAVGYIAKQIRILQDFGMNINPAMLEEVQSRIQQSGSLRDFNHDQLKADMLQLYMTYYLEDRSKGARTTVKTPRLEALENFMESMEGILENFGGKPLFGETAKHINASGKVNREEVIFNMINTLSPAEFTKFLHQLYSNAKLSLAKLDESSSPAEIKKIKAAYANVFKVLQKIDDKADAENPGKPHKAKTEWQSIVSADADLMRNLFILNPKFLTTRIEESDAKAIFDKKIKAGSISPVSPDAEDDTPSIAFHEELQEGSQESLAEQSQMGAAARASISEAKEEKEVVEELRENISAYNKDVAAQRLLKREIRAVIGKNLANARNLASELNYDQSSILDTLADRIQRRVVPNQMTDAAFANLPAKEKENIVSDQIDAGAMAKIFYDDVIRAYVDAYRLQSSDAKNLLPILNNMLLGIDKDLYRLSKEFVQAGEDISISGVIFSGKPVADHLEATVLGALAKPNAAPIRQEVVDALFERTVSLVTRRPHGGYEGEAYKNAMTAIMSMGEEAVLQWNKRANREFHELTIGWQLDQKHLKSYDKVAALAPTEAERRANIVNVVIDAFNAAIMAVEKSSPEAKQSLLADFPLEERAAMRAALMAANNAGVQVRSQLNYNLQRAIYVIHTMAYFGGRSSNALGQTTAKPYLNVVEGFIKSLDTTLFEQGQRPLIIREVVGDKLLYTNDAVDNANLVFKHAERTFGKEGFKAYIEQLFNDVIAGLDNMMGYMGNEKALRADAKQDPTNPFTKAGSTLVSALKAIERLSKESQTAKNVWNTLAAPYMNQYGNFGHLLEAKAVIHGKPLQKEFAANVAVAHEVNVLFDKLKVDLDNMMRALDDPASLKGLLKDYLDNKKDAKNNPFYSARKNLEDAITEIQAKSKGDPAVKALWLQLAHREAGKYGNFGKMLLLVDAPKGAIKTAFVGEVERMSKMPQDKVAQLSDVAKNYRPSSPHFFRASVSLQEQKQHAPSPQNNEMHASAASAAASQQLNQRPRTPTSGKK